MTWVCKQHGKDCESYVASVVLPRGVYLLYGLVQANCHYCHKEFLMKNPGHKYCYYIYRSSNLINSRRVSRNESVQKVRLGLSPSLA